MAQGHKILSLVRQLEKGERVHVSLDHNENKLQGDFHRKLVNALLAKGWKYVEHHSVCTVAYGGETHLGKAGMGVDIITSSLFGVFTQINTHTL